MTNLRHENFEKFVDFLVNIVDYTDLSKHEPGKITFKFSMSAYRRAVSALDGISVSDAMKDFRGIKDYDFSLFWRTLEIVYDPSIVDRTLWGELIGAKGNESRKHEVKDRIMDLAPDNSQSCQA